MAHQIMPPVIDDKLCRSCRRCLARKVCRPKAIIHVDRDEPPVVDSARCYGCLVCMPACPFGAVLKLPAVM